MQQIAQQFSFPLCILFFNRVLYNFSSPFFCASSWYSGLQSTRLQQWIFNWVALYPVFLKFFCIKLLLFVVCGLNKHLRSCSVESVDCVTSGWLKWWQVWRKGLLGQPAGRQRCLCYSWSQLLLSLSNRLKWKQQWQWQWWWYCFYCAWSELLLLSIHSEKCFLCIVITLEKAKVQY